MSRFLTPKAVRKIYRGLLKRDPSPTEIIGFTLDFARNPNIESRLSSLIYGEEFSVMVMPDLVRAASENFTGKRVFFLHVPKTAGTSVRLGLNNALGIPSFSLYPRSTHSAPGELSSMEFWPYWAGHANIAAFPESHTGFTTFRESRSRLLSQYRQRQFNLAPGANPHRYADTAKSAAQKKIVPKALPSFNTWIGRISSSALHWYIPNPTIQKNLKLSTDLKSFQLKVGADEEWRRKVFEMNELELSTALEKSLLRFSAAGWLHQPAGIIEAIAKISGNQNATLPQENEFRKTQFYQVEKISPETLKIMENIREKESILFKVAQDIGLLTDKLVLDEDEIFHKSLSKLGFKLA